MVTELVTYKAIYELYTVGREMCGKVYEKFYAVDNNMAEELAKALSERVVSRNPIVNGRDVLVADLSELCEM